MTSIQRRLLRWLICGFAVASAIAGYGIFLTAQKEAGELFDYELRAVALSLPANLDAARSIEDDTTGLNTIADDRLMIEVWDDADTLVYRSQEGPLLRSAPPGFSTLDRGEGQWRVFSVAEPGRYVQVAQPVSVRETLALRLALHTIWPLALFVPAMVVLVLLVVARGLEPIRALSALLKARSPDAPEALRLDDAPLELRPLVDALNDLLLRLGAAAHAQRTFIADAAHELRSPLAALKLQLEAAAKDGTLRAEPHILERVETRLNRMIRLVQQLLTLAREDAAPGAPASTVSLRHLCEQAIADFYVLAEAKQIDLGLESRPPITADHPCNVVGDGHALSTLLNNLLDNAIRYTPAGGKIDVVLTGTGRHYGFDVSDNGPGIPAEELPRVLDRFYRGVEGKSTGSGLGLSIAARVAQRHALTLQLSNNAGGAGLTATLAGLRAAA